MRRGAVCSRRGDPLRSGYRPDRAARQFLVRSGLRRARLPDPLPLCAARGRRRERRRGPGRALRRDRRVAARRMALAPAAHACRGHAEMIVSMPESLRFVAGFPEGPLSASGLGDLPYAAFGDLRVEKLHSDGGSPTVAIAKAPRRQSEEELLGWIRSSAALITRYFGRFPADGALLLVLPAPGNQIHGAPGEPAALRASSSSAPIWTLPKRAA